MAIIREFTIHGLAGRAEPTHVELDRSVNVFWGLNGTGKTTLLRILDCAMRNSTTGLDDLPFDRASVVLYTEQSDVEITRTIQKDRTSHTDSDDPFADVFTLEEMDAESYNRRRTLRYALGRELEWITTANKRQLSDETISGPLPHSYLPISRMLPRPRSTAPGARDDDEENFSRRVNMVWSRYSTKSLASVRDIQQRGLADILSILFGGDLATPFAPTDTAPISSPITGAAEAFNIVSDFLTAQGLYLPLGKTDFMKRYEESTTHQDVVNRIEAIMERVSVELAPQQELQAVIDEQYIGDKHLILNAAENVRRTIGIEIGSRRIPLKSLSSGEKQLLQILVETLAVGNSTILIDEPEISLHPDWQRGLVASMRRVNGAAQFILATHSPDLQVDVDEERVFEL